MTLDQIIAKAHGYRVADTTGEHNFGEVMDEMRGLLVMAGHALRSYQHGNASSDLAKDSADKIDAMLQDGNP